MATENDSTTTGIEPDPDFDCLRCKHCRERGDAEEMEGHRCFDVLAVRFDDSTVRFMGQGKTEAAAEGIVGMAVMRRGVETEFYVEVPAGLYSEGDTWAGSDGKDGAR